MRQVLQSLKDGQTTVVDVPVPAVGSVDLVVESRVTVVSPGTERMLVEFGRASLIDKARSQPDKVRQLLEKARNDGIGPTLDAVRAKLDAPIPLGYCQAGVIRQVGSRVTTFAEGDRVATNGPHAEFVRVPATLAARIPDGVTFDAAAFAPLAAIGLQGLRLAQPTLGETVVVYGLGLIGLLAVQLARANGCRVIGIDRMPGRVALAEQFGAIGVLAGPDVDVAGAVQELTHGIGTDIVLLTLATESDEPMHAAAEMCRKRGRIVLIGTTGLALRRDDFYKKELSFQVSCSYGPGRYDPAHEAGGADYPLAFVRWTEARNFAAALELMASGRLDPMPLVTHRLPFDEAARAYEVVAGAESSIGIQLGYPAQPGELRGGQTITLDQARAHPRGKGVVGWLGAGNFSARTLIPAFAASGATLELLASTGGLSSAVVGGASGFRRASTNPDALFQDSAIDTIVVATRHDSHARYAIRALESGRSVFVEKPLALTEEEVDLIAAAARASTGIICVGFNRRFAPLVRTLEQRLAGRHGALGINITVNAGAIPGDHWVQDRVAGGGRIVGEACHFIDLARAIAGSPITSLSVTAAKTAAGDPVSDTAVLQLGFADGSVGSIQYLSNGSRAFPKERVEVFAEGRVFRIDNFRRLQAWGASGDGGLLGRRQDKGHAALVQAFIAAVRGDAPPPISLEELLEVSRWAIRAERMARGEQVASR